MGVVYANGGLIGGHARRTCIIIHGYRSLKMVNFCAVVGCSSRSNIDKEKSFLSPTCSYY